MLQMVNAGACESPPERGDYPARVAGPLDQDQEPRLLRYELERESACNKRRPRIFV
jgi:hypothetical protein